MPRQVYVLGIDFSLHMPLLAHSTESFIQMTETFAFIATIPGREAALQRCVESLRPQVDGVCVFYDKHGDPNAHVQRVFVSEYRYGDRGDGAKFYWLQREMPEMHNPFVLVCDDDLEYPPDYAVTMKKHRDRSPGLVGVSGAIIAPDATTYRRHRKSFHCLQAHDDYTPVNVLGTGTLAGYWYEIASLVRDVDFTDPPNVADLHLAVSAQTHQRKLTVVPRTKDWLTYLLPPDAPTIWSAGELEREARMVQRVSPWKVFS